MLRAWMAAGLIAAGSQGLADTSGQPVQNCAQRDAVVAQLSGKYAEEFSGGGFHKEDRVFEIWVAEDASTWTMLMTRADGLTCIVATGTDWRYGSPGGLKG